MRAATWTWRKALSPQTDVAWLLLFALLVLGPGLGLRDPAPPDEPRFALAARTMWESGEWLLPRRGSELYAHKPPVFMWLQAGAQTLVRDWQVAFLLPSLLAALATLWLVQDLGRRLWTRRTGALAALALLATLQFGLQARRAQIDMVLVALTTLSLWALLRHLLVGRDRRLALLAGFAAGLGTITKGVGFLPLLALLPWRLLPAERHGEGPVGAWALVVGFAAGSLVWLGPLLWTVATSGDPAVRAYLEDILFRQTATRYADPWHHLRPAWYYLQVLATLWLPGALLLPWLVPAWLRRIRRRDPRIVVLLGWSLLVLLFFSASPGKREVYILPALPAACLAAAPLLKGLLSRHGPRRMLRLYLLAVAALLAAAALAMVLDVVGAATRLAGERGIVAADLRRLAFAAGITGVLVGAAAVACWRRPGRGVLAATLVLWLGYGVGIAPALDASSSGRALMRSAIAQLPPGARLGLVAWTEQLLLHAPPGTSDFGFERTWPEQWRRAAVWQHAGPQRWLLTQEDALDPCLDRGRIVAAGSANRRAWLLVPPGAWQPGCVPGGEPPPAAVGEQRR